jgi:hypothetical protein
LCVILTQLKIILCAFIIHRCFHHDCMEDTQQVLVEFILFTTSCVNHLLSSHRREKLSEVRVVLAWEFKCRAGP